MFPHCLKIGRHAPCWFQPSRLVRSFVGHGNKRRWLHIEHSHKMWCTEGIIRSSHWGQMCGLSEGLQWASAHIPPHMIVVSQALRSLACSRSLLINISVTCKLTERAMAASLLEELSHVVKFMVRQCCRKMCCSLGKKPSGLDKSPTPCPWEKIPGRSSSHCSVRKAFRRAFSTGDLLGRKSTWWADFHLCRAVMSSQKFLHRVEEQTRAMSQNQNLFEVGRWVADLFSSMDSNGKFREKLRLFERSPLSVRITSLGVPPPSPPSSFHLSSSPPSPPPSSSFRLLLSSPPPPSSSFRLSSCPPPPPLLLLPSLLVSLLLLARSPLAFYFSTHVQNAISVQPSRHFPQQSLTCTMIFRYIKTKCNNTIHSHCTYKIRIMICIYIYIQRLVDDLKVNGLDLRIELVKMSATEFLFEIFETHPSQQPTSSNIIPTSSDREKRLQFFGCKSPETAFTKCQPQEGPAQLNNTGH